MNNKFKFLWAVMIAVFALSACDNDDEQDIAIELDEQLVENLHAPNDVIDRQSCDTLETKPFIYFSLENKEVVADAGGDWDIAFKGTTIIVNGGISGAGTAEAAVIMDAFEELTEVPQSATFRTDTEERLAIQTGSGNGWYNYNSANFTISPIPGHIILVKTNAGNYAKMEILSYYQDNPPMSEVDARTTPSAYYTFRFVLQEDGSRDF